MLLHAQGNKEFIRAFLIYNTTCILNLCLSIRTQRGYGGPAVYARRVERVRSQRPPQSGVWDV